MVRNVNVAVGAAISAIVLGLVAGPAVAVPLERITGTGFWAANAPSTPYSEAGKSFSFSFVMPETYSYTDYGTLKVVDPTSISNLHYSLNGVALAVSISSMAPPNCPATTGLLCAVEMVTRAGGGGLTLDFGDYSVNLFGVDNVEIGANGKLVHGNYDFIPNINGDPSPTDGQINEGDGPTRGAVVPEPAAWAMMLSGFAIAGGALRRRRRSASPA